jgi:hypothetical protein
VGGWEVVFVSAFGVVFISALLALAIMFPHPTDFQLLVFRTLLALSAAGIAAAIPGFLNLSMDATGLAIRAGGALAVFVLVYRLNPARTIVRESGSHERDAKAPPELQTPVPERQKKVVPEIPSLEGLVEVISDLSANQKKLLTRISKSEDGVHVGDLMMDLQWSRPDIVYRGRDLQSQGLIEIQNLTDQCLVLSKSVKKLIGLHGKVVISIIRSNEGVPE